MSYWASNRPETPKAHAVRRKQQTGAMESSKAVWDYGFHNVKSVQYSLKKNSRKHSKQPI